MRKFKSQRTLAEVKKLMLEKGYVIPSKSQMAYDNGSDYILFCKPERRVLYRPHDGCFMVIKSNGDIIATHSSGDFDEREWYQELLNIFYSDEVKQ